MGGIQEEFEGLTITLKKRKLNINRDNLKSTKTMSENDYLVLGHYDQITIKYVNDWWEWTPNKTEALSLTDEFVDKYDIKAYFPENKRRRRYEEKEFDYAIWREAGSEYPFVVVSVINVTEEYVKKSPKDIHVCDAFSNTVLECVENDAVKNKWKEMHCALLPTIGFSDFLLIFKTADLNSTLNLLEQLKEKLTGKAPCLSNAYTMIGFCDKGLDRLSEDAVGGIKLALRFGLRDGISSRQFRRYFEEKLKEEQESGTVVGIEKDYRILGDADFLIVSNIELQKVLPFYFSRKSPGLFHPAHDLFRYYIRSMQSEVRVEGMKGEVDLSLIKGIRKEKSVDHYTKKYQDIIFKLKEFVTKNRYPERIVYGLQIIMKRFLQMVQSGHCFDMEYIIGAAFDNLIKCLEQSMDIAGMQDEDEKYALIEGMFEALNMFRDMIGDYLADMQRSDSLFLEGRSLSHPSIGSATKLLFFYNGYIDSVKEILCSEKEKNRYKFVVTSGGTDETRSIDLFAYLDPADEKTCPIILMTVPEVSLYDVKSSLFRVLHEMLHFCGKRERKSRMMFVIDAVCGYTAEAFGGFMKAEQQELYRSILAPLFSYIMPDKKENVKAEIKRAITDQTDKLKAELKHNIKDKIIAEIPGSWSEKEYFGREIYATLYTIMEEKVFDAKGESKKLELLIYNDFMEYQYELAKEIEKILQNNNILYSNVSLLRSNLKIMKRESADADKEDFMDKDKEFIKYIIAFYLGKDVHEYNENIVIDDEDAWFDLDQILMILQYLFKECYADCMAGKVLNLRPEHFVFSFLTEARNERNAFVSDNKSECRILIDLKYLYEIEDKFTDEVKCQLNTYAGRMKKRGLEYIEVESLISRLQEIIDTKDEKERITALTEPVMAYLRQCEEEWKKQGGFEKFESIQEMNIYSEMETADDIYGFLQSVADKWICYAH